MCILPDDGRWPSKHGGETKNCYLYVCAICKCLLFFKCNLNAWMNMKLWNVLNENIISKQSITKSPGDSLSHRLDTIPHIFHNLIINKEIYIPLANSCYNVVTDIWILARMQNFLMMNDYWLYKHPAQSYFPFFLQSQWWLHMNWRLWLTEKWAGFKSRKSLVILTYLRGWKIILSYYGSSVQVTLECEPQKVSAEE